MSVLYTCLLILKNLLLSLYIVKYFIFYFIFSSHNSPNLLLYKEPYITRQVSYYLKKVHIRVRYVKKKGRDKSRSLVKSHKGGVAALLAGGIFLIHVHRVNILRIQMPSNRTDRDR